MVEFDKTLGPICSLINQCYACLYPDFPKYPAFSFTRAMTVLWKVHVFDKLQADLFDAFKAVLSSERKPELSPDRSMCAANNGICFQETKNYAILSRFIQSVVDLSTNELKVHMLGHTHYSPDKPYEDLESVTLSATK